ncbi:MAG: ABC transporter permease [Desulfobacterales bacterium]|nr:MAG: ABC transporter permease [Desulfobacterales bacterium]
MFKNYLTVSFRNIIKHKGYAFINIAGLTIGLAVFIQVASFVDFHANFDRFHKHADRIYSVIQILPSAAEGKRHSARTLAPLLPLLSNNFDEIEDATRWIPTARWIVRAKNKTFFAEEGRLWGVDPNFLLFFSFKMIAGNPETALKEPNSVVLTESTAHKYFGNENAMGRTITLSNTYNFTVTGVTEDVPLNSSLRYELLVSANTLNWQTNWEVICVTFVRLTEESDPQDLELRFPSFIQSRLSQLKVPPTKMYLLPLTDLYLRSLDVYSGLWMIYPLPLLLLTLAAGITLLLVVCFNFMNLATAQYFARTREIGMRKAVGASRWQLMGQFLGESLLMSIIAFSLAIVLNELMHAPFTRLTSNEFWPAAPEIWNNSFLIVELVIVTLLVGTMAGSYPAFFLSRLRPIQVLRGQLQTGRKGSRVRQILVVAQFVVSILAIVFSIAIDNQYNYICNVDLGYNKERVLVVPLGRSYSRSMLQPLKEELSRHPDITVVSAASYVPVSLDIPRQVIAEGALGTEPLYMNVYPVDYDFIELLEMKIVQGRSFLRQHVDSGKFIISEAAARKLPWENPVGKKLTVRGRKGVIIGVVRDFEFDRVGTDQLHEALQLTNYLNYVFIKLSDAPLTRVVNFIENRWHIFAPNEPFEYALLEERFGNWWLFIKKLADLIGLIGIVAIIFSCLGLLGLASFATQRRTKEIGIRKANGATVPNIIRLLLSDYLRLIAIANIIAWPICYIALQKFVQWGWKNYSTDIGLGPVAFAAMVTLVTGLLAVLVHTIKAAKANPIDSLRYE